MKATTTDRVLQPFVAGAETPIAQLSDDSLVRRAANQDREAFAELVRRHQGKVRGLLLRLSSDRSQSDDLAQEVFLRAYRGLGGFEGRASFATWVYRIAYNVFLNARTRGRTFLALPEGFDCTQAAPEDNLSQPRSDLRWDLQAAVDALPERYRAVIVLHYLEDVSYPEIAEILGMPLGTVKTHLHRAKRLLRAQMLGWSEVELTDEPDA